MFAHQFGGEPDGNVANHYLMGQDAVLHEIADCDPDQTFTLASTTGLSVGDLVKIRADGSGALVTTLSNPAAIATFGRIQGRLTDNTTRGEPHYVENPNAADWTPNGDVIVGFTSGTRGSTSMNVSGLPANLALRRRGVRRHHVPDAESGWDRGVQPEQQCNL